MRVNIKYHLIAILIIALWVALIYSNSISNSFHYDDNRAIVINPKIRSLKEVLLGGGRIVTHFTFYMNYSLSRLRVESYHLFNIAIHTVCSILIYFIVSCLVKGSGLPILPFLVSLLFATHPINTEPVNYICQRYTLLCTMFYLSGFLIFINMFGKDLSPLVRALLFVGTMFCFTLAIFSKEIGATLLITLLLYYLFFVPRLSSTLISLKRYFIPILLPLLLLIFYLLLRGIIQKIAAQYDPQDPFGHFLMNLLTQCWVMIQYLSLLFFPLPYRFNVYHDVRLSSYITPAILISVALLLGLIILAILSYRKHRVVSFFILWWFITHAPTSLIPRGEMMVEYRNYLPLLGFLFVVLYGIAKLFKTKVHLRVFSIPIFLTVVLVFSICVYQRNKVWRDEYTLWSDAVRKSPHRARPYYALAYYFFTNNNHKRALDYARMAIESEPECIDALFATNIVGACYNESGRYQEAVDILKGVLKFESRDLPGKLFEEAYIQLGIAHHKRGQYELAESYYIKAMQIPGTYSAAPQHNLGCLYYDIARYDRAIYWLQQALRFQPDLPEIYHLLSMCYEALGKHAKVIEILSKAIEVAPDARTYFYLAIGYNKIGQKKKARRYLQMALKRSRDPILKEKILKMLKGLEE
jgi:lipopolysaccharide biosynthesis regulator YciM